MGAGPAHGVELVFSKGSNLRDVPVPYTLARAPSATGTWGVEQTRVCSEDTAHRRGRTDAHVAMLGSVPRAHGCQRVPKPEATCRPGWPQALTASCVRSRLICRGASCWEHGAGAGGGGQWPARFSGVLATGPSPSGLSCGGPLGGQSVLCLVCRLLVDLSGSFWDPRTRPSTVTRGAVTPRTVLNHGKCPIPS